MSSRGSATCSCGSACQCGSSCNCNNPVLGYSEKTTTETTIAGVGPVKTCSDGSEMRNGAENDCDCGPDCTCDPCSCAK